jgi:hypothetical protein
MTPTKNERNPRKSGLDGRIDWFCPDIAQFYGLIPRWKEDTKTLACEEVRASIF